MSKSVEAGRRVRIPAGAERPIEVFINGRRQNEGDDYRIRDDREILFSRPLMKEEVSRARWLAMFLGLFGSYGHNESVDIHFKRGGRTEAVTDAEVLP